MKKLFDRNEIVFDIIVIVIYVVGSSVMQQVSEAMGVQFLAETVFDLVLSAVIFAFVKKNGLMRYLGLCRSEAPAAKMLFYIPLFLMGAVCAFFGVGFEYDALGMVLHTVMMILVGFLEEVIFRGFLFRGMAKGNKLTGAVIVSAVTFGIGHIVNLFNGYSIFDSITQIVYAIVVGFLLVFLFMRTGSIIVCIAFHAFNNSMTAFADGNMLTAAVGDEAAAEIITLMIMIVIASAYTIYVVKKLPKRELNGLQET